MIKAIFNGLLLLCVVTIVICWIIALCRWDGKKPCTKEDCETCPYAGPDCKPDNEEERKNNQ